MNHEDMQRAGIAHLVPIPESGGEKEDNAETKKRTETKKVVDPPKGDPPPKKRYRSPRDGVASPPKVTKKSPAPTRGKSMATRGSATQGITAPQP